MEKITSVDGLKGAIKELEAKHAFQSQMLKDQFSHSIDSLRPENLVRNSLTRISKSPDLYMNLLSAVVTLSAGFFSAKLLANPDKGSFKKLLGVLFQTGLASVVATRGSELKEFFLGLLQSAFTRKTDPIKRSQP